MDTIATAQVNNAPPRTIAGDWDRTYRPLPDLFFGLTLLWMLLVVVWTGNTWSKRRWQVCMSSASLLSVLFFSVVEGEGGSDRSLEGYTLFRGNPFSRHGTRILEP